MGYDQIRERLQRAVISTGHHGRKEIGDEQACSTPPVLDLGIVDDQVLIVPDEAVPEAVGVDE